MSEPTDPAGETTSTGNKKIVKRKHTEDDGIDNKKGVKKPPMPTYGKYNILKILKENHCLIADEEQLSGAFPRNKRYDLDDIKSKRNPLI